MANPMSLLERDAEAGAAEDQRRPYVTPAFQELKTRVITRAQLEEGHLVPGSEGVMERCDYVILAYIVKDASGK
jgi:hypothetical protein